MAEDDILPLLAINIPSDEEDDSSDSNSGKPEYAQNKSLKCHDVNYLSFCYLIM